MPFIASAYTGSAATLIGPSGDQTGATDTARINAGLANGGSVQLAAAPASAPYWINAPITPTSQSRLWGAAWCSASNWDNYSAGPGNPVGTVIAAVPSFTGNAFISMTNSTGTQFYGVDLAGFYLDGNNFTGTTTHGMYVDGAWGACFLRGVTIWRLRGTGSCLYMTFDATSGDIPDEWIIDSCKFSAANGSGQAGVYMADLADSIISNCRSASHNGDAWQVGLGVNSKFIGCKGENSNGAGFHFTGLNAGQQIDLIGCSTNANQQDGFLFDNGSSGGLATYLLSGCRSSGDGQAGGTTYGGFRSTGCKSRIVMTGCATEPNATGPAYGAYSGGAGYGVCVTGSYMAGVTAATGDSGTNTHALLAQATVPF